MQKRAFFLFIIALVIIILFFAFYNSVFLSPDDEKGEENPEQIIASWPENSLQYNDAETLSEAVINPEFIVDDEESSETEIISLPNQQAPSEYKNLILKKRQEIQKLQSGKLEKKWILVLSEQGLGTSGGLGNPEQTPEQIAQIHQEIKNRAGKSFSGSVSKVLNAVFLNNPSPEELYNIMTYARSIYPDANLYKDEKVYANLMDSVPLVRAPDVWGISPGYTGEGVSIAIIDTGVDYTHDDLGGCTNFNNCPKFLGGYDVINRDNDPMDDEGHGTHVAATAAGNGVLKGVAPGAKLYAYKVLDGGGSGTESGVIEGIERAIDPNGDGNYEDKADIISMSLGGGGTPGSPVSIAVDNANDIGTLVVVAGGNSGYWGYHTIGCPGCARKALTVGATGKQDSLAEFSSKGPVIWGDGGFLVKPDLVAPGVDICAAQWEEAYYGYGNTECNNDNEHVAISGTSMATPHVSGAAAILLQRYPNATPKQLKSLLVQGSVDIGENIYKQGNGRLDVLNSYNQKVIVSPNPVSLKVYNPSETSAPFSLNIGNIKNIKQGIKISRIDLKEIEEGLVTTQPASVQTCINPNNFTNASLNIELSNLAKGVYSGVISVEVFENCNFQSQPSLVKVPVGFAKLYKLKVTFSGTPGTQNNHYLAHENILVVINNKTTVSPQYLPGLSSIISFKYGQNNVYTYNVYLKERYNEVIGTMVEGDYFPSYDKSNFNYFLEYVDLEETNSITFLESNAQHIEHNLLEIANSHNFDIHGHTVAYVYRENYLWPLIAIDVSKITPILDIGIYLGNNLQSHFNDYTIYNSFYFENEDSFMSVPIIIKYPFTNLNQIINQEEIKSIPFRVATTQLNGEPFGSMGSYLPYYYFSYGDVLFFDIQHLPFINTIYYRDCEDCYYSFHLVSIEFGSLAWVFSQYFNGKAKYAVESAGTSLSDNQFISFFEEPLKLELYTKHCAQYLEGSFYCNDSVLGGVLNDKFDAKSHTIIGRAVGNLKVTAPSGQAYSVFNDGDDIGYPFGQTGSWITDCTVPELSFPSNLNNNLLCQPGIYKILWNVPRIANAGTLRLFAAVQYVEGKFKIKSLHTIETTLELFYKFNKIENGLTPDESLYRRKGTVVGAELINSVRGPVLRFSQGDYVTTNADIDLKNEFTVSAWIKLDKLTSETGQATMRIIDKSLAGQDWPSYMMLINQNNLIAFSFRPENTQANPQIVSSSAPLDKNKWYHVVATFKDGTLKMYVNGVLKGEKQNIGELIPYNNKNPVFVGAANGAPQAGGPNNFFHGSIDNPRIYTRALSDEEIIWLYQGAA